MLVLVWTYAKKSQNESFHFVETNEGKVARKWLVSVSLLSVVLYSVFAYVISLSWMKSDEWVFVMMQDGTILDVVHTCINRWLHANGRLGDIVGSVLGLAENRWQHIFLTPLFIVGAPYAVYALVRQRAEKHLFNMRGFFFVLFFVTIFAISVNTTPWRNYYDYAAAINYLWPSTMICFFLSYFRSDLWTPSSDSRSCALFLIVLGVYCGWSMECITLFFVPLLLFWFIIRCRKKLYVPRSCFFGLCGFMIGAFFLISSPGLATRGSGELVNSMVNVSDFSFGEALEFVCNHSPDNMQQIKGRTVDLYLKDLPLILRPFYFPELISRFVSCCYPLLLFTLLLFVISVKELGFRRSKIVIISLLMILLSIASASSYLYGCVPRKMSYLPAIFIMAVACSYLYINLFSRYSLICKLLTAGAVVAFGVTIFPSALEAIEYKQYGLEVRRGMYEKIRKSEKDALIPPVTYPVAPKNKIGLITDIKHLY